jgi:hypothetical protein
VVLFSESKPAISTVGMAWVAWGPNVHGADLHFVFMPEGYVCRSCAKVAHRIEFAVYLSQQGS